jgi:hypothetical protein
MGAAELTMAARATLAWLWTVALALVAVGASCGGAMAQQRVAEAGGLVVTARAGDSSFDAPVAPTAPWAHVIAQAAQDNGLPPAFLTRLLNQESTMFTLAVSRAGAMGIAQFMPGTAAARGLDDPFDPFKAIPAAARYLADLRRQFGNLGLAAAAYNAGAGRVSAWLRGSSDLPAETRDYVLRITGFSAEDWAANRADATAITAAVPAKPPITSFATAASPRATAAAITPTVPRATSRAEAGRKGGKKPTAEAELCASVAAGGRSCILQTAY